MSEQERKGAAHLPYIIRASGNVSWTLRIRDGVLTILLWALYIYLLHDFFIFLGDIYHWLHDGTGAANAYPKLRIFRTLKDYGAGLGVMAAIFIGWALYNRLRFRNKKRRKTTEPVTVADLAEKYGLDPKELAGLQRTRSLTIRHDQSGRVIHIDVVR